VPIAAFDLWRTGFRPKRPRVRIGPATRTLVIGAGEKGPERTTHLARR
jgi:hypothetical protein